MSEFLSSAVNNPDAFFNAISVDGSHYTMPQLAFFALGCFLWVVAYVYVLLQAHKHQVVEMAVLAGASNLAWEFVWGVLLRTDMGEAMVWMYRAWLFFDLFIFWQIIKLGHNQFTEPFFKRAYNGIICATVVFFVLVYWGMTRSGLDTPIGARSAYVCQFVISVLCFVQLVQQPSTVGYAWRITWLRSLGTLLVSVFMVLHYPGDVFLMVLCGGATLLDVGYCFYFWRGVEAAVPAAGEPVTVQA